ncbi:MAG: hypothetical protein WC683_00915 [bacterium]
MTPICYWRTTWARRLLVVLLTPAVLLVLLLAFVTVAVRDAVCEAASQLGDAWRGRADPRTGR